MGRYLALLGSAGRLLNKVNVETRCAVALYPKRASALPRGAVYVRGTMNGSWRVILAIGTTAAVAAGAFLAIRFLVGFSS